MTLLLDENLSPKLARLLASTYPGAAHVHDLGLGEASDSDIWSYAASKDQIIVSKDADFAQRSLVRGAPPKIIWLRLGNASVRDTAILLEQGLPAVRAFSEDREASLLVLPLQLLA